MPRVNFNGQMQEFNLLTPLQRSQYAEAQALRSAERQDAFRNHSTADDTLRALPDAAKVALRAAGYQGDLSLPAPGPNSGRLAQTTVRNRAGHTIDTYTGDPRAWMNFFSGPVRHRAIAFRRHNQTESSWDKTRADSLRAWVNNNSQEKTCDAAAELSLRFG